MLQTSFVADTERGLSQHILRDCVTQIEFEQMHTSFGLLEGDKYVSPFNEILTLRGNIIFPTADTIRQLNVGGNGMFSDASYKEVPRIPEYGIVFFLNGDVRYRQMVYSASWTVHAREGDECQMGVVYISRDQDRYSDNIGQVPKAQFSGSGVQCL